MRHRNEFRTATTLEASAEREAPQARGRWAIFQALHNRDYRYLWLGQLGQSASLWVETLARSWLVWQLTGSATALATVNLLRALPMVFFGILAGVIADRMDKRRLLTICQTFTMLNLLLMAVLITTGTIQLWMVYVSAFFTGSAMAFLQPTRTAMIPGLVSRAELTNAVALNNAAMNVTRIAGPSLAGILIAPLGINGVYFLASAFYLWTIWSINQIKAVSDVSLARKTSVWSNLIEGLRFCWEDRIIFTLMVLALIPMTFGMPYMNMMPVFADRVLHIGPEGLGILYAASGAGALVGSLFVAGRGHDLQHKGIALILGVVLFGGGLMAFAASSWVPLSLLFLALVGMASTGYMALTNAALLEHTPSELQGRVMSIYLLDRGLMPLGTMTVGLITDAAGAPLAFEGMGAICVGLALLVLIAVPQIRRI